MNALRSVYLKAFSARNFIFSSLRERPVAAVNLVLRASATLGQTTFSGTVNGTRPGSEKALSHVTVAQACGSWLPCTITTTGSDNVHT